MALLASNHDNDPIDVLVGDWMSEGNMTVRAGSRISGRTDAYEPTFLEALEPALPQIAKYSIRVAVNAGASDTEKLHQVVRLIEMLTLWRKLWLRPGLAFDYLYLL